MIRHTGIVTAHKQHFFCPYVKFTWLKTVVFGESINLKTTDPSIMRGDSRALPLVSAEFLQLFSWDVHPRVPLVPQQQGL